MPCKKNVLDELKRDAFHETEREMQSLILLYCIHREFFLTTKTGQDRNPKNVSSNQEIEGRK